MTKKHFIELAKIIGSIRNEADREQATMRCCCLCESVNKLFDRALFCKAVEAQAEWEKALTGSSFGG